MDDVWLGSVVHRAHSISSNVLCTCSLHSIPPFSSLFLGIVWSNRPLLRSTSFPKPKFLSSSLACFHVPSSKTLTASLSFPISKHFEAPISSRFVRKVVVSAEFDQEEEEIGLSDGGQEPSFSPDLKLFVGNLPFTVDSAQLAELFERTGNVEMFEVIYDKMTGWSRGFAFVTMSCLKEVKAATQ